MKIGNLYNLASFKKMKSATKFSDAASGIVLARNLVAFDPKVFEKKYAELTFVNSGITVDNTGGFALAVESLRVEATGSFKLSTDDSGNKGKVSLNGDNSTLKVVSAETHANWTYTDVKTADLQNIDLVSRYIKTINQVYMQEVDQFGYLGITGVSGSTGLLNFAFPAETAASDNIEDLAADVAYNYIANLITNQHTSVSNTPEYSANKVVMPIRVMNHISARILNSAGSTKTILAALKENFPAVDFTSTLHAESVGGTSVTVAYSTNEEAMVFRVPLPLEVSPVFEHGFKYSMDAMYRIAGLDVLETSAGRRLTGL